LHRRDYTVRRVRACEISLRNIDLGPSKMVAERMFKLYLTSILVAEVVALAALAFLTPDVALFLVTIIPLTLLAAFILRRRFGGHVRSLRRLSPEAIARYRSRVSYTDSPEALSRAIVERAEEIQRSLEESPSDEVRVEMCALGYRACANDMITLTHLTNEALQGASFIKRFRLRRSRKKAIDSLSEARKALPPGALRTAPQEK
jgi:ABC-type multidrug transport system fused ATPase/permease subunit